MILDFRRSLSFRDCVVKGRGERLTSTEGLQCGHERQALLAKRGELPAQAGERLRAAGRAAGARELRRDLEHRQVLLRLSVVEGDRELSEEGEHLLLAQPEARQQLARGRWLAPAALPRPRCPGGRGGGGGLAAGLAAKHAAERTRKA